MQEKILKIFNESKDKYYNLYEIVKIGLKTPLPIKIENKKNTIMRWSDKICPFSYGEILYHKNPVDNMNWDIIVSPDSNDDDENLLICGIVKIKKDANKLPHPIGNKPGNDKLILANEGDLTSNDKKLIDEYFKDIQAFDAPIYFESSDEISEEWEKELLGPYNLGHFKDKSSKGIVVGNIARNYYGAKPVKNNLPKTN